jgi:peptidase S41-like protein
VSDLYFKYETMSPLSPLTRASCFILTLAIAWSAPLPGQARIPDTPAGQALRAWLDAYNSSDSTRVAAFLRTYQVDFPIRNSFNFRQMTGGWDVVSVEVSEPRHVEFLLRPRNDPSMTAYGLLDVAPLNPTSISGNAFPLGPNVSTEALRIDRATRVAVVGHAAAILDSFYFSPAIGKQLSDSLRARLGRGAYDRFRNGPGLALRLNDDLAEIAHDKHLGIRYVPTLPPQRLAGEPPPAPSRADLDETNCGFKKVEQLDGNVGYVRFDSFEEIELCGSTAGAAMSFVAGTHALIIDLRDNGGGKPEMVALIASYLFDHRTHLGDLWDRYADSTHHYWTQDSVPGRRFGSAKPVYVLTSAHTFSAAEEFAYDLQALKRVTVVGETTGGGAHPASEGRLGDHFAINVPWGNSINPITGTNWERVGVLPDLKVPASDALDAAVRLSAPRSAPRD